MRFGVLLLLILLLAAVTRFSGIQDRSLWEDEGWTLLLSKGPSVSDIVQTMAFDQHPPLYFILFHQWFEITGDTEFAIRAFSAFTGILSVAALYQLGRVLFNEQVGVLAALLLAVWDFSIDISQDARQYGLLTLFTLLSCVFYIRYFKLPTRTNGLGWWLCSVLALYTQYVAGVVLAIQMFHLLMFARPLSKIGDGLFRFLAIGLAFLPWLVVFFRQNQVRWDYPIFYQSGLPNNEETFILIRDALVSKQFGLVLGLVLLGLMFVRYAPHFKIQFWSAGSIIFLAVWTVFYIGLFIYLNEQREILRIRIFSLALPPILLLAAHGLANLQLFPRLFLVGVLLAVNLSTIDSRQNNPPWREVTRNITRFHQEGELILMDIWVGDFSARYYIERQMKAPWVSLRELRDEKRDFFLPELKALLENRETFWLMRWNDDPAEYDGLLAEMGFQRTTSPYVEHVGNKLYSHRYDRLTEERLATFGDTLTLIKAHIDEPITAGKTVTISFWWAATETPPVDYSISVFLMDSEGNIAAQKDEPPIRGTSTWQPAILQFDQHKLEIPENLPAGSYLLGVRVYWYVEPDKPLSVESEQAGDTFVILETINLPW
ncbi:MAG: glycosyltransferase family 39 protein [Anaerolineae bacterium]|nr:glycosyltransferase family 39 protein [Anaerolineae bacterium]